MAFSKSFERGELNRLFRQRTHWLRRKLRVPEEAGAGPPEFSRKKSVMEFPQASRRSPQIHSRTNWPNQGFTEVASSRKNNQCQGRGRRT